MQVKICGITSEADAREAIEAGADTIGLNFVPGTPRALEPDVAGRISALCRGQVVRVGVFRDESLERVAALVDRVGLDVVQLHGDESPEQVAALPFPVIKALPADGDLVARGARYPKADLLLDHPSGRGQRPCAGTSRARRELVSEWAPRLARGWARSRTTSPRPCAPRAPTASTPPRGSSARPARRTPSACARSCARARGGGEPRERPDARGYFGRFGGRYVPELLMPAVEELTETYAALRDAPDVLARARQRTSVSYAGRPDAALLRRAHEREGPGPARLSQARGPGPHRRAQDQQRHRPGIDRAAHGQAPHHRRDRRGPARRGRGDGLRPLRPRVRGLHGRGGHAPPGAERVPHAAARRRGHSPGHLGQPHAQGRHERGAARLGHQRAQHLLPDRLDRGPAPLPAARARPAGRDRRGGARADPGRRRGACPTCSSPASAAAATRSACSTPFATTRASRMLGVEAGGQGVEIGAARGPALRGQPGVLHGSFSYVLQDDAGQIFEAHSISAGSRLPGRRPGARLLQGDPDAPSTRPRPTRRRSTPSST